MDQGTIGEGQGLDRRERVARQGYEPIPPEQRVEEIVATERRMIEPMGDGRGLAAEGDDGRAAAGGRSEVAGGG